ncbi:MAG TPA: hypothetical protein DCG32_10035 [Sphaerochaeta sp.]|nr:hypothetical protein [Sphaerochaeta sp.]
MALYKKERFVIPKGSYRNKQKDKTYIYQYTDHFRSNERYQYPRASPGLRRRCLLFRPKGLFISPCFPLPRSVMESW